MHLCPAQPGPRGRVWHRRLTGVALSEARPCSCAVSVSSEVPLRHWRMIPWRRSYGSYTRPVSRSVGIFRRGCTRPSRVTWRGIGTSAPPATVRRRGRGWPTWRLCEVGTPARRYHSWPSRALGQEGCGVRGIWPRAPHPACMQVCGHIGPPTVRNRVKSPSRDCHRRLSVPRLVWR
jgi:hypothetical protein